MATSFGNGGAQDYTNAPNGKVAAALQMAAVMQCQRAGCPHLI
jgi:hypothetical protein